MALGRVSCSTRLGTDENVGPMSGGLSSQEGGSLELSRSLAVHVGCRIDMLVSVKTHTRE